MKSDLNLNKIEFHLIVGFMNFRGSLRCLAWLLSIMKKCPLVYLYVITAHSHLSGFRLWLPLDIPEGKLCLQLAYLFINWRKWNLFIVYEYGIVIKVTVNTCVCVCVQVFYPAHPRGVISLIDFRAINRLSFWSSDFLFTAFKRWWLQTYQCL